MSKKVNFVSSSTTAETDRYDDKITSFSPVSSPRNTRSRVVDMQHHNQNDSVNTIATTTSNILLTSSKPTISVIDTISDQPSQQALTSARRRNVKSPKSPHASNAYV